LTRECKRYRFSPLETHNGKCDKSEMVWPEDLHTHNGRSPCEKLGAHAYFVHENGFSEKSGTPVVFLPYHSDYSAASARGSRSGTMALSVWRGRPIRTGWNNTAAAIVHSNARAIILPILDMPG
jgi:hypothetical protein